MMRLSECLWHRIYKMTSDMSNCSIDLSIANMSMNLALSLINKIVIGCFY